MKIEDIDIGYTFEHGFKGQCVVIDKTLRTITVRHKLGTTKVTYKTKDVDFKISDF